MSALPAALARTPRLLRWIRVAADGAVEVRSGKVELGQGILTALAQLVAHELQVPPERVRMAPVATGESPDEGMTSGSLSMQDSGAALRQAAAEVREAFLEGAARALGVAPGAIAIEDGEFVAAAGRTSYAALAARVDLDRDATGAARPREPAPVPALARLDLPDKIAGRPRFLQDLVLPGMAHGRVLRPPSPAAGLESIDLDAARTLPGVLAVVREGRFVGVVAEREDEALRALEHLRRLARWRERATLPDEAQLGEWLRAGPCDTTVVAETGAVPEGAAARTLAASFSRPFIAHASLAPSCALARWDGARLEAWSHTQGPYNLRADLACAFALAPEAVVVTHVEGAGCYGHNGADDVALDAALLARALPGRPVRVSWSRADELAWSPLGPAMAVDLAVDLDAQGEVLAWRGEVYSPGHSLRPGRAPTPTLLAAAHLGRGWPEPVAINMPAAVGGGSDRNAIPGYALPAVRVRNHRRLGMPLRTSALRSLGAHANVFAIESVVDEIARSRGEDPIAWRLRHLDDPRARAVVEAAARAAPWSAPARGEGFGRGFGYARYKGTGAWCAAAVEVHAAERVRVRRIAIAADVGRVVNRAGVEAQLEGGALQAVGWALLEAVRFDATRVTSDAWERYPVLRFGDVPAVEVVLLDDPRGAPLGAGEASLGPVTGAIANAIHDALGVRMRDLPFTPERFRSLPA